MGLAGLKSDQLGWCHEGSGLIDIYGSPRLVVSGTSQTHQPNSKTHLLADPVRSPHRSALRPRARARWWIRQSADLLAEVEELRGLDSAVWRL